jgi:prepilin-type processing-associated H-X9-DG protein
MSASSHTIFRHNGDSQSNFVFGDGHVETKKVGTIPLDTRDGWTNARKKFFFWNPIAPDMLPNMP